MTINEVDAMKWLIDSLDHLQQYRKYSARMAERHGMGFTPDSSFTPLLCEVIL